jgi:hypothetical protein
MSVDDGQAVVMTDVGGGQAVVMTDVGGEQALLTQPNPVAAGATGATEAAGAAEAVSGLARRCSSGLMRRWRGWGRARGWR